MQDIAVQQGMVTMVQDGLLKALDGITTLEEVFSVAE
jgi:type II secretory ATPase GspE/PulE/Tfp pilus assembly ATPase PilB-like protein